MLISTVEIIEESWAFYKKYWQKFKVYIFFLFFPTLVLSILASLGLYLDSLIPATALVSNIILLAVLAASILFWVWTSIVLNRVVRDLYTGGKVTSWKNEFNSSSHLIWPFILVSVLVGLVVVAGSFLFIIPGIIFYVWYKFAMLAVVLDEAKGSIAAMSFSKSLVNGRWWTMFVRIIVPNLLFGFVSTVLVVFIFWPLGAISSGTVNVILHNSVSSIVAAFFAPLIMAAMVILYESAKKNPVPVTTIPTV